MKFDYHPKDRNLIVAELGKDDLIEFLEAWEDNARLLQPRVRSLLVGVRKHFTNFDAVEMELHDPDGTLYEHAWSTLTANEKEEVLADHGEEYIETRDTGALLDVVAETWDEIEILEHLQAKAFAVLEWVLQNIPNAQYEKKQLRKALGEAGFGDLLKEE